MRPATNRPARQRAIARTAATTDSQAVGRILATYFAATADEHADGRTWYRRAYATADTLRQGSPYSHRQAVGTIAALSPQTSWASNLDLAAQALQGGTPDHFPDAQRRVREILSGADPLDVLGGRKVRSFYCNIREPDAPGRVTVDRHAVALAFPTAPPKKFLKRIGAYQLTAAAYRTAARTVGLLPHELQAVCWLTHRRLIGVGAHHDPSRDIF